MAARPLKRARTSGVRVQRPIDKQLKNVLKTVVAGTQVETVLETATFPGTIVGLRWVLSFAQDGGTGLTQGRWAIVNVKDGLAASSMSKTDAGDFYTPEEQVLAFGLWAIDNNNETKIVEGTTKTMRKLQRGDQLLFVALGEATETVSIDGIIQFFYKT